MTPYFVPPRELISPLQAAALAGVDVAVILPERNNLPYVHRATRHMLWELLERGVQVYYQPPPFVHSKLFYVDDHYAQIGSANFDSRSLRLELRDERRGVRPRHRHRARGAFRSDPREVSARDAGRGRGRPFLTKTIDGVAWLFSPYL